MAGIAGAYCGRAGIAAYWGVLFAAILFLAVGNLVFLIRRKSCRLAVFVQENKGVLHVLEAVAAVLLLVAGIVLRAQGMDGALQSSVYFDAAKVAEGQRIPQMVHGAVYYYVQMLHMMFLLVGNHFQAALWLQIALQLLACVALFFAVRRLAGPAAALVVLGFCTCSPYMTRTALELSPANFLFCVLAAAGWLVMAVGRGRLNPPLFFLMGVPVAFCCYIDIIGVLLLFFALAAVFALRREPTDRVRRVAAVLLCLAGTAAAFFLMIYGDGLASAKEPGGVLQAWWLLYRPEGFRLPVSMDAADAGLESLLLAGVMAFGVFGFWGDKKEERMSVWVIGAMGVVAAQCWGIFTEELPGSFFLYLLIVILAGVGFGECFRVSPVFSAEDSLPEVQAEGLFAEAETRTAAPEPEASIKEDNSIKEGNSIKDDDSMKEDSSIKEDNMWRQDPSSEGKAEVGEKRQIQYIENPLPLPKKHVKRVLDYPGRSVPEEDDFDYPVSEEDDFDI